MSENIMVKNREIIMTAVAENNIDLECTSVSDVKLITNQLFDDGFTIKEAEKILKSDISAKVAEQALYEVAKERGYIK